MMKSNRPSWDTIVGLSVTLGRLPGASWLAWPGVTTKDWRRVDKGMPVSPAITEGSHAPLGVAENAFPLRSITLTQVVSRASEAPLPPDIGADAFKSPGRLCMEARAGS